MPVLQLNLTNVGETVANMNIRPRNIVSAISNTVCELQVYKYFL